MTLEIIKAVRKAEQDAEKVIEDSVSRSRDIISNAEKDKHKILENAIKEGEREAAEIMKQMESDAQREEERIYIRAEEEGEAIKKATDPKIDSAVDFVIEKVVKSHGNS